MQKKTVKPKSGGAISCRHSTIAEINELRKKDAPLANTALFLAIMTEVYKSASKSQREAAAAAAVRD